ncbi:type II toxin-antitoxin system Phd/YefM family antitoxin [Neomoorella thermoacetica]|uniref:type II toxin-antitoxin system Phd/YefM family antitoxin n=1 Tax=Neomoorella thermoacetica TaxID=1525 RepID=UPI000AB2DEA8|nr:type II toxin-antitoxin system Phd/YefM family antitoxin [Moorella thermoacetica]
MKEGREVIIAKADTPVARPVPITSEKPERYPGSAKGQITIALDFNAPLPEAILKEFEE